MVIFLLSIKTFLALFKIRSKDIITNKKKNNPFLRIPHKQSPMSATVEALYTFKSGPKASYKNNVPVVDELNPLKQVQTGIAPTKRQKIIANRRKNFQMKKKTELCKNYILGEVCPLGEKCSFAHGVEELKPRYNVSATFKTIKCKHFHNEMFCQYGPRCQFLHNDKKGEIKPFKPSYTQLYAMMEDSFTLKNSQEGEQSIEDFFTSNLNLKASRLSKLEVFESLRCE